MRLGKDPGYEKSLKGRLTLFVNGGTALKKPISCFFFSDEPRLAIYTDSVKGDIDFLASISERTEKVRVYSPKECKRIVDDLAPIKPHPNMHL